MKDSLDFLQNYCEEFPDESISEPEFVAHDALNILRTDVICHHGILGMKWGIRRYQNKDGSLTAAGKNRYYRYPNESGALGNVLTNKGKKALKDKNGNWKNNAAGQVAKDREDTNNKIQEERNKAATEKAAAIKSNLERLNKEYKLETHKGYYGEYSYYKKESPKDKKRKYEITIDADDIRNKIDFKKYDDFEKNSDAILKQCENAAYDGISDWLKDWAPEKSKEEVIKNLNHDTPSIRFTPGYDEMIVTYYSPDIDHFPSVEYNLKKREARPGSVDG